MPPLALGLFFVYAASLGITIGLIVVGYTTGSVVTAFLSASAMFGAAAIYGHVTKRSLAKLGGILFMGLIGLLVAMVLNIFIGSTQVTWIISIVGVVLFTALTAYDVQRIQSGDHRRLHGLDGEGGRHRRSPALPGLHQHLPVHAPPPRRPQLAGQAGGLDGVADGTRRGRARLASEHAPRGRLGRADGHVRGGPRRRARAAR